MDDNRRAGLWLALAGLNGAAAVIAGALGAHAATPGARALVETGSHYQLVHAVALAAIAALTHTHGGRLLDASGVAFVVGCVLFCGGLYLRAAEMSALAFLIPVGGAAFIVGWLLMASAGLFGRRPS